MLKYKYCIVIFIPTFCAITSHQSSNRKHNLTVALWWTCRKTPWVPKKI
uniref:Uncharacterized protein n=1 Tax=Anguilla anguilla TaxID=7936 RepID=A0A0E9UCD1_ANGAN